MAKNDSKAARPAPFGTTPAGPSDKGIKVIARPASFRRAGFTFTAEPQVIRADQISEEQLHQLMTEPNLVVQPVDVEPELDEQAAQ
jgi:hypothetical protein